jgi:hypothetical protein
MMTERVVPALPHARDPIPDDRHPGRLCLVSGYVRNGCGAAP